MCIFILLLVLLKVPSRRITSAIKCCQSSVSLVALSSNGREWCCLTSMIPRFFYVFHSLSPSLYIVFNPRNNCFFSTSSSSLHVHLWDSVAHTMPRITSRTRLGLVIFHSVTDRVGWRLKIEPVTNPKQGQMQHQSACSEKLTNAANKCDCRTLLAWRSIGIV